MAIIQQYHSPDGLLKFVVERLENDDIFLGFEGFPWHTHADILANVIGLSEEKAVRIFIEELVESRAIIAIARVGGKIHDVWITDNPHPDKYRPDDETIEFRYWDGRTLI